MLERDIIDQLDKQGKTVAKVEKQIEDFKNGFPFMDLIRPATVGDGIRKPSEKELLRAIKFYEGLASDIKIIKFVPASGAASRMFKELFAYMKSSDPPSLSDALAIFFKEIKQFAFYQDLTDVLKKAGLDMTTLLKSKSYKLILEYLLTEKGLNYGNLPKGLLKFHSYENESRTPMQEHMVEGAAYAASKDDHVYIHCTVSPEHEIKFKSHIRSIISDLEMKYKVKYEMHFSQQKPGTDTIAVDLKNNPFILDDGSILFRPAGHGALIENLNDLDGDVIFIKNIDNVVPDHLREQTNTYKKALAGILLQFQEQIFYYLNVLEQESTLSPSFLEEIASFIKNDLCIELKQEHGELDALDYFKAKLNRPIRVCGMVKNEGEPGGGPFWASNRDDTVSLQVVESAQVDFSIKDQADIAAAASHFNPVDLVCGIRDYKGNKFDLSRYVDPMTGFISQKSQGGRDLKALELPGLWNGSMSDWVTIFVEVPIETFNPVKVVNDLLRPQHQPLSSF